MDIVNNVIFGVISGVFIGGAGYLKNRKVEEFNFKQFGKTLFIGFVAGLLASFMNTDLVTAEGFLASSGFIVFVERIFASF